jgi:transposase InsO family protein
MCASAGGRGCRTRSVRTWSSGSWRLRSPIPASGPGASRPSWPGRSGAGSGSRSTASGACCGGWVLNTRSKRLALVARHRDPYERKPQLPEPERHIEATEPGEKVQLDCFYVGRLSGTKGTVWQYTAIDVASAYAWAELRTSERNPRARHTRELLHRVARELAAAGWKLREVGTDNGSEFRSREFGEAVEQLGARQRFIKAGRPNSNGCVERLQLTILEECWRPAFARSLVPKTTALQRDLDEYLTTYNTDRAHTGRLTNGRLPADIVHGARKTKPVRSAPTVATSRG